MRRAASGRRAGLRQVRGCCRHGEARQGPRANVLSPEVPALRSPTVPAEARLWPWAGVRRGLLLLALAALGAYAAFWVLDAWAQVRFPYQLDYGEGPILNQVRLLSAGLDIYSRDLRPPYIVGNYPPVYPAAVALLHLALRALGRPASGPGAGRALSAAATLATAVLLGWTVAQLGGGRAPAWLAGLLFLAQPYVWRWGALQRVDALALAWSSAGLLAVARAPERGARAWPWFLLAALTRQDAVAALAAAAALLWPGRRREAVGLLWRFGVALAAAAALLTAATRGAFFVDVVLDNVNAWSAGRLGGAVVSWLGAGGLPLLAFALWGWSCAARLPEGGGRLLRAYLLSAAALSLTAGKVGAAVNYFLPLIAAGSMLGGLVAGERRHGPWAAVALAAYAVGVPPLADRPGPAGVAVRLLTAYRDPGTPGYGVHVWATPAGILRGDDPDQRELTALLRRTPGPILSENMTDLVLAGHPVLFQPFEMTQLWRAGRWRDGPLVRAAAAGDFSLVVLEFPLARPAGWDLQRWPANLLGALLARYRLRERLGEFYVYAPAAPASPPRAPPPGRGREAPPRRP